MSYSPEPCFCSQAQEYEDLLERARDLLVEMPDNSAHAWPARILFTDITVALGKYQDALAEYNGVGDRGLP
jgi:hypothetical protein